MKYALLFLMMIFFQGGYAAGHDESGAEVQDFTAWGKITSELKLSSNSRGSNCALFMEEKGVKIEWSSQVEIRWSPKKVTFEAEEPCPPQQKGWRTFFQAAKEWFFSNKPDAVEKCRGIQMPAESEKCAFTDSTALNKNVAFVWDPLNSSAKRYVRCTLPQKPITFNNVSFENVTHLFVQMPGTAKSSIKRIRFDADETHIIGFNGKIDPMQEFASWTGLEPGLPFIVTGVSAVNLFT